MIYTYFLHSHFLMNLNLSKMDRGAVVFPKKTANRVFLEKKLHRVKVSITITKITVIHQWFGLPVLAQTKITEDSKALRCTNKRLSHNWDRGSHEFFFTRLNDSPSKLHESEGTDCIIKTGLHDALGWKVVMLFPFHRSTSSAMIFPSQILSKLFFEEGGPIFLILN